MDFVNSEMMWKRFNDDIKKGGKTMINGLATVINPGQIFVSSDITDKKAIVETPEEAQKVLEGFGKWAMAWILDEGNHPCMAGYCNRNGKVVWMN